VAASTFAQIDSGVQQEVLDGVAFALNAPYPGREEVSDHVYA
jgi:TPP-dependent pyruvate/acetoin dehydrogenase alpha subunit